MLAGGVLGRSGRPGKRGSIRVKTLRIFLFYDWPHIPISRIRLSRCGTPFRLDLNNFLEWWEEVMVVEKGMSKYRAAKTSIKNLFLYSDSSRHFTCTIS